MSKHHVTQLTLRLPEELHNKLRVIAAFKISSINVITIEALEKTVAEWETKHGVIVMPEED